MRHGPSTRVSRGCLRREGGCRKGFRAQKVPCCEQGTDKVTQGLREVIEQVRAEAQTPP